MGCTAKGPGGGGDVGEKDDEARVPPASAAARAAQNALVLPAEVGTGPQTAVAAGAAIQGGGGGAPVRATVSRSGEVVAMS